MKTVAALAISVLLLACAPALAQGSGARATESGLGPGAASSVPANPVPRAPFPLLEPGRPVQKFFDLKNSLAIATFGAALAADSYSTQRALAYPNLREGNPVAQPFVSSRAGEIAYSAAGFALFGGGLYLAHRTGHHRVERIAPWIVAGWEGILAGWNWHQVAVARSNQVSYH